MRNYFIALCLLLLAGCTKTDVESVNQQKINSQKFYAEFAEEDTRTFVDEKVRLLWTKGDLLTIFTSTLNRKHQFDGETGDNSGTFSEIVTSQFGTGNSISANYAVYPYASSNKISNDEVITISLPTTQKYAEGSFGQDANTMVAVTSGPNDYFLPFKNVGGFLRLRLYGEGVTVKSIELKGNNSEKIAGKATVTAKYGQNPELEMSDDATGSITLDCSDGVALGATAAEAKDFWIVVPPTTFTKGFTITITDTAGATMEKSTTKSYVVERNVLKSMTAFEVEIINASTPPNNQIWYTSSAKVTPSASIAYGATIVSNDWNSATKKGVITFDEDIIYSIDSRAFQACTTLISIILPENINTIGVYAFSNCSVLESIVLPNKLLRINDDTFLDCKKLINITIPNNVTRIGAAAFMGCTSLVNINIPEKVTFLDSCAFYGCTLLEKIYCEASTPPTFYNDTVFEDCNTISKIYVPSSSVNAYKEAKGWKEFADKIVGYDFSN